MAPRSGSGPERARIGARRGLGGPAGARGRQHEDLPLPGLRPGDPAGHRPPGRLAGRRPRPGGPPSLAQSLLAAAAAAAHARRPGRKVTGGMGEIRASTVLPARREPVTLHTADGLSLVGELALPAGRDPVATLICLHPLPTHGGMMDSHLLRKAAYRLPALADLAVLRFNTRGTASEQGRSEGDLRRR